MGRAYSQPEVGHRPSTSEYVIFRVNDPDDEFASTSVLCWVYDPVSGRYDSNELEWKPTGSSYDGNAVVYESRYSAESAIALILFGRDSVSVRYEL